MRKFSQFFLAVVLVLGLLAFFLFMMSSGSFEWQLSQLLADVKYALNPAAGAALDQRTSPTATTAPLMPSPTPTIALLTPSPTSLPSPSPMPVLAPTQIPTPPPSQAVLEGVVHQFQKMNNNGPANLAMALSFWGWKGDQRKIAASLKPNDLDKNVMPYELEAYVEQETDLEAVVRVGGDLTTLKALVSAGYPVIVERGFEGVGLDGWMGHYQVISGYDDAAGSFTVQDSYKGPDYTAPYDQLLNDWRAFNYTYLVIYPVERRQQVLEMLGLQAYDNYNNRYALQLAEQDAAQFTGRDLFLAQFNQGTNLVSLQDYARAAEAYDAAFANYAQIPSANRPWRMLWYQTGPYFAYFFTGRYQEVIDLATQTLDSMSDPILEESLYWRARALLVLGDEETAVESLEQCLVAHPGFEPCIEELLKLGFEPPPTRSPGG